MLQNRISPPARRSLLQRYSAELALLVERQRSEAALVDAKKEAERAADQARKAMYKAQAADRAKTAFLANMSHELRTPLNAIIGFSEMMVLLGDESMAKYREYAGDISASGQHLLELINDVLDLAKVESGKLELEDRRVDVTAVVDASLTFVKDSALERGLELSHALGKDLPPLRADERKLRQILTNLLSNAVKFTPQGGKVCLKAFVDGDGALIFRITDTGIGIAIQDIPRALTPFEQVRSRVGLTVEGTGLGLPLTKGLIELHDGELSIDSELGRGTEVTVRLPKERVLALAA